MRLAAASLCVFAVAFGNALSAELPSSDESLIACARKHQTFEEFQLLSQLLQHKPVHEVTDAVRILLSGFKFKDCADELDNWLRQNVVEMVIDGEFQVETPDPFDWDSKSKDKFFGPIGDNNEDSDSDDKIPGGARLTRRNAVYIPSTVGEEKVASKENSNIWWDESSESGFKEVESVPGSEMQSSSEDNGGALAQTKLDFAIGLHQYQLTKLKEAVDANDAEKVEKIIARIQTLPSVGQVLHQSPHPQNAIKYDLYLD